MTAQTSDIFIYNGDEYSLVGIKGGALFRPEQYGMEPAMISTACYRGYYAAYELTEEGLYLRELNLREKNEMYPPIGDVQGKLEGSHMSYKNLSISVPFSGSVRLAKDFVEELYIHMGFQKPTAFGTVLDITLQDGKVINILDRSTDMERKRGAFKKQYESGNLASIIDAFSLDMDLE